MLQRQDTFRNDGMLMIYSMNDFESTSSLMKQSIGRHVTST